MKAWQSLLVVGSLSCLLHTSSVAADKLASSDSILKRLLEQVKPGDTIAIKNGSYSRFHCDISVSGKPGAPITVQAQTPGKVIFEDDTTVRISGSYVVLKGFYFQDGYDTKTSKPVVTITGDHNRVTECAFWKCHNRVAISSKYLEAEDRMPKYNRIDRCYFADNFGWHLYLDLGMRVPGDDLKYAMYNRIDHNYFSNPFKFGNNTGAAMRIGLGAFGYGRCLINSNLFERQNSEVELIENKSNENVYLFNTFLNCESDMSFRQGSRTVFINNYLMGTDPKRRCGGLQIWSDGHLVAGNYFSFPHGSYVPLRKNMTMRPDRLPPAVIRLKSGYKNFTENGEPVLWHAAKNVTLANNVLYANPDHLVDFSNNWASMVKHSQTSGYLISGSQDHLIQGNLFYLKSEGVTIPFYDAAGYAHNGNWKNNQLFGYHDRGPDKGFHLIEPGGGMEDGVFRISRKSSLVRALMPISVPKKASFSEWLQTVPGIKKSVAIEELANRAVGVYCAEDQPASVAGMTIPERPSSFSDVGPEWLTENPSQFAKDGTMTPALKVEIEKYLRGNAQGEKTKSE